MSKLTRSRNHIFHVLHNQLIAERFLCLVHDNYNQHPCAIHTTVLRVLQLQHTISLPVYVTLFYRPYHMWLSY